MFPLPSSSWIRKVPKLYPPAHPYGLLYDVEETFFDEVSVSILPVAIQGEVKNGLKNHGSWEYDFIVIYFFLKQLFSPGKRGFEWLMFISVYWPKPEVKMGGCWPFLASNSCASFRSAQTPALCNQCVESLTQDFFSRSIFAVSLSSCYNEEPRDWHMFTITRVLSISLTITGVKNIVGFTEGSLYRGSLRGGSSVLSKCSSSPLVRKIIWVQLIILCDPPILTMWATR